MALGVVSAIHSAHRSGKGQFLDVGMYDAMLAFQKSAVAQYGFTGKPNPAGLQRAMTLYPFDLFPPRMAASPSPLASRATGTCCALPWNARI